MTSPESSATPPASSGLYDAIFGWTRHLNRYHWFVLLVASLGWLFDTMDQQLFVLARQPAMEELIKESDPVKKAELVRAASSNATAIFLMGWATGGIGFGILGDRLGRAKTMLITILVYSVCTGLSAFSVGVWDFALYRFLTGLGVGGEFAVGVALVAEVMPTLARPFALALLQALSAVGNITAALIYFGLTYYGSSEDTAVAGKIVLFGSSISQWRLMFVIGTLPALLALVIRRNLKEPERWTAAAGEKAVQEKLGSMSELFGTPIWRGRAILGMILALSGVIGLWGIGFFSPELIRTALNRHYDQAERVNADEAEKDREFLRGLIAAPDLVPSVESLPTSQLLSPAPRSTDAQDVLTAIRKLHTAQQPITIESVLAEVERGRVTFEAGRKEKGQSIKNDDERKTQVSETAAYLGAPAAPLTNPEAHLKRIADRVKRIKKQVDFWVSITSILQNIGGFFGVYSFGVISQSIGRKSTFALAFFAAMCSTAGVFAFLTEPSHILWMIPIMGFCQLSLFGGYAVYFPELFPTRLRSTGTSFCYNVGRFLAAVGPPILAALQNQVFTGYDGFRWAGVTMCSIFLLGIFVIPFAPETRGKPLPE